MSQREPSRAFQLRLYRNTDGQLRKWRTNHPHHHHYHSHYQQPQQQLWNDSLRQRPPSIYISLASTKKRLVCTSNSNSIRPASFVSNTAQSLHRRYLLLVSSTLFQTATMRPALHEAASRTETVSQFALCSQHWNENHMRVCGRMTHHRNY